MGGNLQIWNLRFSLKIQKFDIHINKHNNYRRYPIAVPTKVDGLYSFLDPNYEQTICNEQRPY